MPPADSGSLRRKVMSVLRWRTCRTIGMALGYYLQQLVRPVVAGMIMCASVYFLQYYVYGNAGEWLYLLQPVAIGVVTYSGALLLIHREGVAEALALLRS